LNLIVTIDTEEDNWSRYSATDNPVTNIEKLIRLQHMFDRYQVRPTYLISYPVATNLRSVEILKRFFGEGKCEIGTHCHPWNTPPFDSKAEIHERDTMLSNLPERAVFDKISTLHEAIVKNFGTTPVSFRAGRWGFGPAVAKALCRLHYQIDSSVCAFTDWRQYHGPDYSSFSPKMFRFNSQGLAHPQPDGPLLEVPATVGFTQNNFKLCQKLTKSMENSLGRRLRLKRIMDRLGLVNKVWLSPETEGASDMIALVERMEKKAYPCVNLTFHSSSLLAGLSPFVKTFENERRFNSKIEKFLSKAIEKSWRPITLSEVHVS